MSVEIAIRHRFGDFTLDVAFAAPPGVTALFGRSGAGKTTVVNAVAGLLRPHEGRICIDGETLFDAARRVAVPVHRRRIGYVFQEGRLFPHLTVEQNLRYGHWFAPRPAAADFDRVVTLLGIGHLLERRPASLSGGEKQRVAMGRALLASPRLLLMDEPLASLDEGRKAEILPYLEHLRDEVRIPILYVSHSLAEVTRLATTLVTMDNGRVIRCGPVAEVLSDPAAFPTGAQEEAGAVWRARVVRHHDDGLTELDVWDERLWVARLQATVGAYVRVRIRARDIVLSLDRPQGLSALNVLPATVISVVPCDSAAAHVQLMCGADRMLARLTQRSVQALGLTPGRPCFAILKSIAVARSDIGTFTDGDV